VTVSPPGLPESPESVGPSQSPAPPGPPGSAEPGPTKGDRTRQSLIAAAIARFARDGYRGSSVADICRDAGLSTTASYPYFPNKEALFVAAVDEDVAGLIVEGVSLVVVDTSPEHWGRVILGGLVERMDKHPLARRIVSGLEPEFTMRLLDIPALEQLRKDVASLIADQQVTGGVRRDIEPVQMANGIVIIVISLLMATVQTGGGAIKFVADDVEAVLNAATRPPKG
jgi:AcrR family transcriptional regulator